MLIMRAPTVPPLPHRPSQRGVVLIEALVSILLFSMALLGLIRLQATLITATQDAKYRADAAFMADQLIGTIWADRRGNLDAYAHRTGGSDCPFDGTASSNANVTSWLGARGTAGTVLDTLPHAANGQQILIGADNQVTVTLCWKVRPDAATHKHVAITKIKGGP